MSWLKIFFKDLLGFTDGLNGQFLIAHCLRLHAIEPPIQVGPPNLVPLSEQGPAIFQQLRLKAKGDGGGKTLILLALRLISLGIGPAARANALAAFREPSRGYLKT